jgi:hypothetical protein
MLSARTHNLRSASYWRHAACDIACSLMVMLPLIGPAKADEQSLAPLIVDSVLGDVRATTRGTAVTLKPGSVITLPASLSVGANSALELHQGKTIISAAANSQLDIPLASGITDTLERVIQSRGNVFYSVAKRQGQKLRVETPYLVAVIKGTQFNVAAEDLATTISLFEGRLEVDATDSSDVVDLQAGHIALRSSIAPMIRVVNMDTGETLRAGLAPTVAPPVSSSNRSGSIVASNNDVRPVTPESTRVTSDAISMTGASSSLIAADDRGVSSTLALNDLVAHAFSSAAGPGATDTNVNISTPGTGAGASTGGGTGINIDTGNTGNTGTASNVNTGTNVGVNTGGTGAAGAVNTGSSAGAGTGTSANTGASAGASTPGGTNVDLNVGVGDTNVNASVGTGGTVVGVTTESGDDKSNNGNGKSGAGSSSSGQNSGNSSKGSNGNSSLEDALKSLTKKSKK